MTRYRIALRNTTDPRSEEQQRRWSDTLPKFAEARSWLAQQRRKGIVTDIRDAQRSKQA